MAIFSLFQGAKWRRRPWYRDMVHELQLQAARTQMLRDTGLKMIKGVASDAVTRRFLEDFDRRAEEYWNEDAVVKGVFHRDDPASGAVWTERAFTVYAKLYVTLEQREAMKVYYGVQLRNLVTPLVEAGYLNQQVAERGLDLVINGSNVFTSIEE
ncbi:MAG: hypothetical protein KDA91_11090, partial [Planctomycetaceae bacterium]|nr:hypothetical protein [Planctomycetaceae bacterium]